MISDGAVQFDDVLALAYRLSPLEKVKLVKRMADSLEQEPGLMEIPSNPTTPEEEKHWGRELVAFLHTLDTSGWQAIDMSDVVEWVIQQRAQHDRRHSLIWEDDEVA